MRDGAGQAERNVRTTKPYHAKGINTGAGQALGCVCTQRVPPVYMSPELAEIGVQYDHDRAAATATVALAAAAAAPSNGAIDGPAAAAAVAAASPIGSPTVWAAVAAAAASPGPGVLGPIRADGLTGPSAAGSPQTRAGGGGGGGGSGGGGSSAKLLALGTLGVYQGCIRVGTACPGGCTLPATRA